MTALALREWPTLDAFYDERGGRFSGESDAGVWWRSDREVWRISLVASTADVYAVGARSGRVLLLANVAAAAGIDPVSDADLSAQPASARVRLGRPEPYGWWERFTDDAWWDRCGEDGSLSWAAERLSEWKP